VAPDGRSSSDNTRVLILATDPMVAALVGLLLDPDRYDPIFPGPGERPEDALARARPPLVLLVDCDMDVARSDLFFARTTRTRATVVLFGAPGSRQTVIELAQQRGVPCVHLPTDRAALTLAIQTAITRAMSSGAWSIAAAVFMGARAVSKFATPFSAAF
jgi:DNA-binding response OmpR family regulator